VLEFAPAKADPAAIRQTAAANIMIFFIAASFDKNLFFYLYDNETVSRCSKKSAYTLYYY
jgi:hypothetical protein